MKSVQILLSTYNGAEYLQEQLDSLYAQKDVNVKLLVRDDGSSDATHSILDAEQAAGRLEWYTGGNLRPAKSFWDLVQKAPESEYYAFCDQDDVWLEDKMKVAVDMIKEYEEIPCMYCSAYQMVDAKLNPIPTPALNPQISFHNALLRNIATGCTMVFNQALMKLLKRYVPDFLHIHDDWVYKICLAVGGKVIYDTTPYIYYRQHGKNSIGGIEPSFIQTWTTRVRKFFNTPERRRYTIGCELHKGYSDLILEENRKVLEQIVGYTSSLSNISLAFTRRFYKNLGLGESFKVFVMFIFRYY